MSLFNLLLTILLILISVAFFTIMERKLLSYIQLRKGPNKVGMLGLLQPFSDALKLFNKNNQQMKLNNKFLSTLSPALAILISILLIPIIPLNSFSEMDNKQNMILFMIVSSLFVYSILLVSWSTNSKYATLGAIRNIAQLISYEVNIFFIILFIAILTNSYSFPELSMLQLSWWLIWGNLIIFIMWVVSCLAEMNRTPFDFAESESELVSGFNVEYMGGFFALIFLAEYSSIIIMSMITTILFTGSLSLFINILILISFTLLILWTRGTFPRLRYDILMSSSWKFILPFMTFSILFPFLATFY